MDFAERAGSVVTRQDFAGFVAEMLQSLQEDPDDWENSTLETFLSAMEGFVLDMDGYYANRGLELPHELSWRMMAEILCAARIYE